MLKGTVPIILSIHFKLTRRVLDVTYPSAELTFQALREPGHSITPMEGLVPIPKPSKLNGLSLRYRKHALGSPFLLSLHPWEMGIPGSVHNGGLLVASPGT